MNAKELQGTPCTHILHAGEQRGFVCAAKQTCIKILPLFLPAAYLWASHIVSLRLSVLICNMGIRTFISESCEKGQQSIKELACSRHCSVENCYKTRLL